MPRVKEYRIPNLRVSLVREGSTYVLAKQVSAPTTAASIFGAYLGTPDREHFVVAILDTRNRVIALNTVSIGTLNQSLVHPREVFKSAILAGGAAIVLAHNHPSGDPEPSQEDLAITRRLVSAGKLLGIEVLDHIVLGADREYVSLKERGVL